MASDQAKHNRELEQLSADLTQKNQNLLEADRARYSRELESFRAQLVLGNEENLSRLRSEIEIQRHTYIQEYKDKLAIYRLVSDIVSDLLTDLDSFAGGQPLAPDIQGRFNRQRMKAYGYLAMLASQDVIDSFDRLMDQLLAILNAEMPYEFEVLRELVIDNINKIRMDIGINKSPIEYRGQR